MEEQRYSEIAFVEDTNCEKKKRPTNTKKILYGAALVLVTNICMISTNYLVRWRNFSFPEVGLARGIIQFVVFGPVILHTCWKTRNDKAVLKRSKYSILYVIGYGVFIGSASAAITSAIHMMPIGELVVICFTAPLFCLVFSRIFLDTSLTALNLVFSVFVIIGATLVVQPEGLFTSSPEYTEDSTRVAQLGEILSDTDTFEGRAYSNQTKAQITGTLEPNERDNDLYYVGVGLSVFTAIVVALGQIVTIVCNSKGYTASELVLSLAFVNLVFSLTASTFIKNRLIYNTSDLIVEDFMALSLVGILYIIGFYCQIQSINITRSPNMISMMRTTEIPMTLVTESFVMMQIPDSLAVCGSLLVTASVMLMSVHDSIIEKVNAWVECCKNKEKEEEYNTKQ